MDDTWLKLWRKLIKSPVFQDEGLLKLWILCLCKASHKNIHIKVDGIVKPITLEAGQFITGRFKLHGNYHQWRRGYKKRLPSPYTAWRWLEKLQDMQMLSIKSFNKFSIITINNWELYQGYEQQASNRRATGEHKQEGIKKVKRISYGKLEALKGFLSSLPEFIELPKETQRLIAAFLDKARLDNKTQTITGSRIQKALTGLITISGETSLECLNTALEITLHKAETNQFTFGKQNVTGYVKAIARGRYQKVQKDMTEKYEPHETDVEALYS